MGGICGIKKIAGIESLFFCTENVHSCQFGLVLYCVDSLLSSKERFGVYLCSFLLLSSSPGRRQGEVQDPTVSELLCFCQWQPDKFSLSKISISILLLLNIQEIFSYLQTPASHVCSRSQLWVERKSAVDWLRAGKQSLMSTFPMGTAREMIQCLLTRNFLRGWNVGSNSKRKWVNRGHLEEAVAEAGKSKTWKCQAAPGMCK